MNERVLLIGNGINNISVEYTWKVLIEELIDHIGAKNKIQVNEDKPFPLLYEEISVKAAEKGIPIESEIKKIIGEKVKKFQPNKLHTEFSNLSIQNILTTNYDLTFENTLNSSSKMFNNCGTVKESRYSIFRHYKVKGKNIWHIHGDVNSPNSITLGYEHYSGYLQQMRNYIVTGTGNSYKKKYKPLTKRLKNGKLNDSESWLDFFFTKDIYIIGLTLDFVEIHLWWLLTFRQRARLINKMDLNNKIVYFYPDTFADKIKNKIQLLESLDIETVSCKYNKENEADYYMEVIKKIDNCSIPNSV